MVGVASPAKPMMRPMSIGSARGRPRLRGRPTRSDSQCRIRGTDYLTNITIGASPAAAGDVLFTTVVNPKTLAIARLATMSTLFERYKFKSLKFRYAPTCPTTTAGQLLGYVDYDTYDDPTGLTGIQNLQRGAAHYGEKPTQVWEGSDKPIFWEIKDVDPMTDLYVDSDGTDPRWTNQGRFVLLAASAITATTACGNIYLDYDIEFYIPQIELTPTNGFSYKIRGGGTMSAADLFGTAPTIAVWNNLPVVHALGTNSFTLPPGSYDVCGYVVGTTLSIVTMGGGTSVDAFVCVSSDAKNSTFTKQFYSAAPVTFAMSMTAATVTETQLIINLLPSTAMTLSQRRLDRLSKTVDSFSDLSELKVFLEEKKQKESKRSLLEEKCSVPQSIYLSASQSEVTSVAARISQIEKPALSRTSRATSPRRNSDEYEVVK